MYIGAIKFSEQSENSWFVSIYNVCLSEKLDVSDPCYGLYYPSKRDVGVLHLTAKRNWVFEKYTPRTTYINAWMHDSIFEVVSEEKALELIKTYGWPDPERYLRSFPRLDNEI